MTREAQENRVVVDVVLGTQTLVMGPEDLLFCVGSHRQQFELDSTHGSDQGSRLRGAVKSYAHRQMPGHAVSSRLSAC